VLVRAGWMARWPRSWAHLIYVLPYLFLRSPIRGARRSGVSRTAASPASERRVLFVAADLVRLVAIACAVAFASASGSTCRRCSRHGPVPMLTTEAVTPAGGPPDHRCVGVVAWASRCYVAVLIPAAAR
jgi:ABC-type uncharacterized transport system YnjBCD permease subunit